MKIYHNPQCSKSNAALELIKFNGIDPQVVEYLQAIPKKDEIVALLAMLNLKPLELIRTHEPLFQQKFKGLTFSDEQWIDIMLQYPELIERPIVVKDGKAIIARPIEKLLDLIYRQTQKGVQVKNDIIDRADVEMMVNTFYAKVKANEKLGYIFDDIAKVDWELHLPKMYSFWASILLGERSFSGNPMVKHIELSKIASMTESEFNEWISLFTQTVDDLFEGEIANEAKVRAVNIARFMSYKIQNNNTIINLTKPVH